MMAAGRISNDKNCASPGRNCKAILATDVAAAAVTKPWTMGPSTMSVTGVEMISKARTIGAMNMLMAFDDLSRPCINFW
jgi:hypothetical protein